MDSGWGYSDFVSLQLAELEMELESKGQALQEMTDRCEQVRFCINDCRAASEADHAHHTVGRFSTISPTILHVAFIHALLAKSKVLCL